jgi:hypothetical protein
MLRKKINDRTYLRRKTGGYEGNVEIGEYLLKNKKIMDYKVLKEKSIGGSHEYFCLYVYPQYTGSLWK